MIFGRKKRDERQDNLGETTTEEEGADVTKDADSGKLDARAQARAWDEAFDREEGPFDISEVDLEADEDEVRRLDFGPLVLTPFEGMQLQLNAEREQRRIQSVLVGDGASALEVTLFAGPVKESMTEEIRDDIVKATVQLKGRLQFAEGPFGTELRRAVPTQDPEGNAAMHVSRTWLVSGPGWVLRGVLMGKAALEPQNEEAQLALFEFFSNVVVRRDSAAAVPGRVIYLKAPQAQG